MDEENQTTRAAETANAPLVEGSGAFRWHPAVGVMIFIVLLMLALPMGMIGWHLRGWQQERAAAVQTSEEEAEGLRQALEVAADKWSPSLELSLPEVVIEVTPADFARVNELLKAEVAGLTLVDRSENQATYWGPMNRDDLEYLQEKLKEKIQENPNKIYSENVGNQQVKTRITIKSEK